MGILQKLTSITPPRPVPGTPGYKAAVLAGRFNVWIYRRTGGRIGGRLAGSPVCILHHRGAKTGTPREAPLLYLLDGEDTILVASMGGSPKHPSWYHNLRAHPDTEIERDGRRIPVTARAATPPERDRLWPRLVAMYPGYGDYQARTDRQIPVIVCSPRSP